MTLIKAWHGASTGRSGINGGPPLFRLLSDKEGRQVGRASRPSRALA